MIIERCFVSGKWLTVGLESGPGQTRLTDDAVQGSSRQFGVYRHRDGYGPGSNLPLHHNVTSSLSRPLKPMLFQDAADGFTRERSEFTQPIPRPA